jgi:hypothetical protein
METPATAAFSATDGFVIAMLAVIFLSFGTVGMLVICMRRNATRRDPQVDDLLDEIASDEKRQKSPPQPADQVKPAEPWERESDWWKK